MSKGHRDNAHARKKRGDVAFAKKQQRRRPKYYGPWNVTFACGQVEYCAFAGSDDIKEVVKRQHASVHPNCEPKKYQRLS